MRPCSAERSCWAKLTMEPRSVGIEEHRAADLDFDVAAAYRVVGAHALADALRPMLEHTEADPMTEHRREGNRGHVPLVIAGYRRRADGNEMSARAQARRTIHRLEADQRRPVRRHQRLTLRQ